MLIPVLDINNKPLMPCRNARARLLIKKGSARSFYQKGIFCIKLNREPSARNYQNIAVGIDPGSKREGYTVLTKKYVVLNITTNTPAWVKDHLEIRRNLRRSRRQRKTPYRACRENRSCLRNYNRIPPSTKARWNAKLRILKLLMRILPITIVNVEDIAAKTKEGKDLWNKSFSPLEIGKDYFYSEIEKLNIKLIKTEGYATKQHRDKRVFKKSKNKLDYIWAAHNVDSHSLAEIAIGTEILPNYNLYKIEFLEYHRRQLHVQNFTKGGIRKQYGSTVSLGMSRGSIIRYKNDFAYLGGSSKGKVAVNNIETGKRINQFVKVEDIEVLYNSKWKTQFMRRDSSTG